MTDPVIETFPLGMPWATVDPFLFCVHHHDDYPAGDDQLAPAAPLDDRDLGQDFSGLDGWSMYHGQRVPGFPQHPHRGFETVTFVREGLIDHSDSLGAAARFGTGDTQWLTAGGGIVHCEMFPLLRRTEPNPLELFQIWLNLPAEDKLVEPHFAMLWNEDTPRHEVRDELGRRAVVTVVAGRFAGRTPAPPPPHSWAARPDADVAIWHLALDAGAALELPPTAGPDTVRTLYVFAGSGLEIGGRSIPAGTGAVVRGTEPLTVVGGAEGAEVLVLQGRPIGEPVAQYGPFVMNTEAEIHQAFADYRRTGFGGWPWPTDDPNHGPDRGRFARHVDGHLDEPRTAAVTDA